jgi:hypothetical protein
VLSQGFYGWHNQFFDRIDRFQLCSFIACVLLFAVFYLRAAFGTDVDTAVIESPFYNVTLPACLSFYYLISSPAIILNVLNKKASNFVLIDNITYNDQVTLASWNKAFVMLPDGITQLRLNAEKFSKTASSQFVIVDRINLIVGDACHSHGESNYYT